MSTPPTPPFAVLTDKRALETGTVFAPRFDADGLVPAIVSDSATGVVLMFAWMNRDALLRTVETQEAHFWSRSRRKLWRKGEESGNVLRVEDMRTDCDQDALLISVRIGGDGVACHTGARSCFYRTVRLGPVIGETIPLATART